MSIRLSMFYDSSSLALFLNDPNTYGAYGRAGESDFMYLESILEQAPFDERKKFAESMKGLEQHFAVILPENIFHVDGLLYSLDGKNCQESRIPEAVENHRTEGFSKSQRPLAEQVVTHYHRCIATPALQGKAALGKRGVILRAIADYGTTLTPQLLEAETDVKQYFPWFWIDAMENLSFDKAGNAVLQRTATDDDIRSIFDRIPSWRENHGDAPVAQLLKSLYALRPEYREQLRAYAQRHAWDIPFD